MTGTSDDSKSTACSRCGNRGLHACIGDTITTADVEALNKRAEAFKAAFNKGIPKGCPDCGLTGAHYCAGKRRSISDGQLYFSVSRRSGSWTDVVLTEPYDTIRRLLQDEEAANDRVRVQGTD